MGSHFHLWALVLVCRKSFSFVGAHLQAVGIGGGLLMWHLVPVGVNEIEGEGKVSTCHGR